MAKRLQSHQSRGMSEIQVPVVLDADFRWVEPPKKAYLSTYEIPCDPHTIRGARLNLRSHMVIRRTRPLSQ